MKKIFSLYNFLANSNKWKLAAIFFLLVYGGMVAYYVNCCKVNDNAPLQIRILALAHPDDESQVWSFVQNSKDSYKVFAYMTLGEETFYCDKLAFDNALLTDLLENNPGIVPDGKYSDSCKTARINSTIEFLNSMAKYDPSLPSNFKYQDTYTMPLNGSDIKHCDNIDSVETCTQDLSVRVYDGGHYGKALFFNLGDGDLTSSEVEWAISSIINNRLVLDIPSAYSFHDVIGGFYNANYVNCYKYVHADHKAIHTALSEKDFGMTGFQAAATCASNPNAGMKGRITDIYWSDIVNVGYNNYRNGQLQKYYGWLDNSVNGWSCSYSGQTTLIMRNQSFWAKFSR